MLDNPMLRPQITDDRAAQPIGKCANKDCDELLHKGECIEFEGVLFCGPMCLGRHLINEGYAVKA